MSRSTKKGKVVAITFDDGPHPTQTPKVLDILKEYNAKATFFCIGKNIDGHENILERIDKEGHTIGNHSLTHSNLFPLQSTKKIITELDICEKKIENVIHKKINLFRPSFGVTNPLIAKAVKHKKYITIGWNIRSFDTLGKPHEKTVNRIKRKLKPGSVLLLHDRLPGSDLLLKMILEMLKTENYEITTIGQLFDI